MTKYGLPPTVVFCKICVQSNQRPNTSPELKKTNANIGTLEFENGICSACKYHYEIKSKIDWKIRLKELKDLCEFYKSEKNQYDVLVPGSGGKDSIFVSHYLREEMNLKVLTCTWAPHIYTDEGLKNLFEWKKLGFDHILVTPNYSVHSKLTKLAFINLVNPFQPFIIGQKNMAPKIAEKFNIKFIMYGENNAEVHNNFEDALKPDMNTKHFTKKNGDELYFSGYSKKELEKYGINDNDLKIYEPLDLEKVEEKKIKIYFMSYFIKWSPHENYYYVMNNCKFFTNQYGRSEGTYTKFASLDDKTDGQNYFTMHVKFGHGRATNDCCRDIRDGYLTRDEAIKLVKKYDGEFPKRYFKDFLNYIDISENEYWEVIDAARPEHLWKREGNKFVLKHIIT